MIFLGIDLGTSALKICAMDGDGAVQTTVDAPLTTQHPSPEASEQDPTAWYDALVTAMAQLPASLRQDVKGIGLSGQMHGAVLLDESLAPIRPAILWNDGRAARDCAEMMTEMPEIGHLAGVPAMAGFTAPKLRWLAREEPEAHAHIHKILLPKDYLGLRLHGRCATDPSDAAGTHWYDQAERGWSDALCKVSQTDSHWLPDLQDGPEITGTLLLEPAAALGLSAGTPIVAGAGDAAAGALGIGAIENGDGFLSLGTSGQVFITTADYRPNPESMVHAYAHTLPGRWFQMACLLNGARPLAWLSELLNRPIPDLLQAAETTPPGPLFLPYLTGERTPHGDTAIRGAFYGMDETTTPGALAASVVEGIAFSFADAADALAAAGPLPDHLLAIGGGTRSDFVLQSIANAIGVPLGRSTNADVGPALGAARLARFGIAGGEASEVFAKPEVSHWFTPEPDHADPNRRAAYRALYPALKGLPELLRPGSKA